MTREPHHCNVQQLLLGSRVFRYRFRWPLRGPPILLWWNKIWDLEKGAHRDAVKAPIAFQQCAEPLQGAN